MTTTSSNSDADSPSNDEPVVREGSQAIVDSMIAGGVEIVFGYTGGSVPALTRSVFSSELEEFAGRTELTAAWMSYGYNRVKRRSASAVISWTVGALHVAPAVYAAKQDGTPLLLLIADNPPAMEARDGLQDSVEVFPTYRPLAKYLKKVTDAGDLPVIVRQAIKEASTGRFGPSVLDLAQTAMFQETSMKVEPLTLPSRPAPQHQLVTQTWELLMAAKRPVFYVGAGVHISDAAAELRELAELLQIPVVSTSWGGRGLLPDRHELYFGPSGNFGWRSANDLLQQADLWITVGSSFSQMSTGSWTVKKPETVVHVDIDVYEVGKIFEPTLGVVSDAREFFSALIDIAKVDPPGVATFSNALAGWRAQASEAKDAWLADMDSWFDGTEVPINQYYLIRTLSDLLPRDALVIADSGGNAFGMYRAFEYKEVTPLATGSRYQSLGVSLPVAIGAKLAAPEKTVVSYHGDGGFYYDLVELSNLTQKGLKVIVVLDNNHALLANRASAKAAGMDNPWVEVPETTDFVKVAAGFGVDGERVTDPADLPAAIERALASEGSYLLDVHTTPGLRLVRALSNVIPMVGDRTPKKGHLADVIEGSWPS